MISVTSGWLSLPLFFSPSPATLKDHHFSQGVRGLCTGAPLDPGPLPDLLRGKLLWAGPPLPSSAGRKGCTSLPGVEWNAIRMRKPCGCYKTPGHLRGTPNIGAPLREDIWVSLASLLELGPRWAVCGPPPQGGSDAIPSRRLASVALGRCHAPGGCAMKPSAGCGGLFTWGLAAP